MFDLMIEIAIFVVKLNKIPKFIKKYVDPFTKLACADYFVITSLYLVLT